MSIVRPYIVQNVKDLEEDLNEKIPSQSGKAGKFLQTTGTHTEWVSIEPENAKECVIAIGTSSTEATTYTLPDNISYIKGAHQLIVSLGGATLSPDFYSEESGKETGESCDKITVTSEVTAGQKLHVWVNTTSYCTSLPVISGSALTTWEVSTVVGTATYVLPSPSIPSSTSSDYNVFLGVGRLYPEEYTLDTETNSIVLDEATTEVTKLSVQYCGQKFMIVDRGCKKNTTQRSIIRDLVANTEYVFGELDSLQITLPTGTDTDSLYVVFKSGSTPTTFTIVGTNYKSEAFVPGQNKYIEMSGKWYLDKWLLVFHQLSV